MAVEVIRPGLLTTIQDSGRPGYRKSGVGPGGVMDEFSYRVANMLVGNDPDAPALEFFFPGPELHFTEAALISITGPDGKAFLNEKPVPFWRPLYIAPGTILKIKSAEPGIGYLGIHSGWKADHWLGSASTHATVGLGGYQGRKLGKGDELFPEVAVISNAVKASGNSSAILPWSVPETTISEVYGTERHVLCMPAPETELLGSKAGECFASTEFHLSKDCSRMGFRLGGAPIPAVNHTGILSSPVTHGTVQLLPDGQLIALMADHQTTGGYPRIASIVRTEWPRFNRFLSGKGFYFAWCTSSMSIQLLEERTRLLTRLQRSCLLGFNAYIYNR